MWVARYANEEEYNWCIADRGSGEPVGFVIVTNISNAFMSCEVVYCLGRAFWGKGIMPEALRAVFMFLFKGIGVNRITAKHDLRNPSLGRVMEKCGMQYEGTIREVVFNKGEFATVKLYAILKSDFEK